ncbi:tail completion protein gp17 [Roseobacter sp. CCS2]|uniref:tail completion protein gp17 n=1 Tax=Roseobacter sp. CCS2 TaxID=391593 RepID=UPI0000F3C79A|nr:DUF3168 domain-containing protein [Roseobacter sp. CCS2]EBA11791.1 hypothetical protein RCCS2_17721 [Roseobacter sp. CCS2]
MEEAFTDLLQADAGLAALCDDRIHWGIQPDGIQQFPYLNLTLVSDPVAYYLDGEAGVQRVRVQLDAWAESYLGAVAVQRAASMLLSGYIGTVGVIAFKGMLVETGRDLDGLSPGDAQQLYGRSVDVLVHWGAASV